MRHVVWDWNGTLFDDQHLVVDALNAVLVDQGLPTVDLGAYQQIYTRPVQAMYERLFGRPIAADEWQHIDDVYHDGYAAALEGAALHPEAAAALDAVEHVGRSQSLLSMYRHDGLLDLVERFGIAARFVRVDGLRGPGGGLKAPHLAAHLEHLVHLADDRPSRVLVVGDALDDAAAASHVGAHCVLFDGGSHPREELERTGYPVADSLTGALDLAGL